RGRMWRRSRLFNRETSVTSITVRTAGSIDWNIHTCANSTKGFEVNRPLRVAIIGAGPAGIYAADALMKSDTATCGCGVSIDLFERMPAPFGLIRYGVAPDHPRIKGIVAALHKV